MVLHGSVCEYYTVQQSIALYSTAQYKKGKNRTRQDKTALLVQLSLSSILVAQDAGSIRIDS